MSHAVLLPPIAAPLSDGSRLGGWWHAAEEAGRIVCDLCPRACALRPGDRGFCFVRENRDGQMVLSTYGRSTGFCIDPIEKKPLNHFYPGTSVLSFGTAGCNLGCKFCQNHDISKARQIEKLSELALPETIAEAAERLSCRSVAFTYNDPVIWAEYAIDTARACHDRGIKTVAVTAGYITPEARGPFYDVMDAANVDLKAFTEEFYCHLTLSHLQPVLDTLAWLKAETKVWFEITNLVIPRANDTQDEFRQMCDWVLKHVGDEVPVHFTAFHPDFKMLDRESTPVETLLRAYDEAVRCGLKYVYVGNVHEKKRQSTYCPKCSALLIERDWYALGRWNLKSGCCQSCGHRIAGHFDDRPGDWGRKRLPVQISRFAPPEPQVIESSALLRSTPGRTVMSNATSTPRAKPTVSELPPLSETQEAVIHRAACEHLAAAARGRPPQLADPTLEGLAEQPVMGAFVSAKRQGRLRGCCGAMSNAMPLGEALAQAAWRTAVDDVRLPPILPDEIPYLDVEVWLLYGMRPVAEEGEERIQAVEIGRHGLQVARGENRGLLLPGVAVEHGWTSQQFLDHVSIKAGLPPTAWKERDTQLQIFEGRSIAAPMSPPTENAPPRPSQGRFTAQEIQSLASFCRHNLAQLVEGATPYYYLANCSDGTVNGVALRIAKRDSGAAANFMKLALRPGLPMQSTVFQLIEAAAKTIAPHGATAESINQFDVDVALLYDVAMHGTADEPDLRGFDPSRQALLVAERNRSAWLFDPSRSAKELLSEGLTKIGAGTKSEASLYSACIQSSVAPFEVVNVPKAQAGRAVRPPTVAGAFYPADEQALAQLVQDLLPAEPPVKKACAAAMVPHAGLAYSGRVAAEVLSRIEIPSTVIVIGPKHTSLGVDWAVAPHETWALPGGSIASDRKLAEELVAAMPGLQLDAAAHQREHAIEVELPFLARLAPQSKVVGIALGAATLEQCQELAAGLASVLKSHSEPILLLISSDMNHFASDRETRRLDELALSALETLDPEKVFHTVRDNQISMCGLVPAVIVLEALRKLDRLGACERVAYATSADTTGDASRVVGYAGMLFA